MNHVALDESFAKNVAGIRETASAELDADPWHD
jgi:hypothetical protein